MIWSFIFFVILALILLLIKNGEKERSLKMFLTQLILIAANGAVSPKPRGQKKLLSLPNIMTGFVYGRVSTQHILSVKANGKTAREMCSKNYHWPARNM